MSEINYDGLEVCVISVPSIIDIEAFEGLQGKVV